MPVETFGANPAAISHRALWPDPLNSPAQFDRASRAEILVFVRALAESELLSNDDLKGRLGIDAVDTSSIRHVQSRLWEILAGNYAKAAAGCEPGEPFCPDELAPGNLRDAATMVSTNIQPRYRAWFDDAMQFHRAYLNELLRLAAIFPRVTSEIETFNDNEIQGWDLPDRHFLLSFDDGPRAEDTDLTLAMLRLNRVNAVFFAVGDSFQDRLRQSSIEAMKELYSGMCVGIHGWSHRSHAAWPQWEKSVLSAARLISDTLPESYVPAFRPPYGERRADSGGFFLGHGLKVVLWNIDSRDWQDDLAPDQIEQRVMSLMLLWRRGFVLFHDFFPRSRIVVPRLIASLARDDISWVDCGAMRWGAAAP